MLQTKLISIMYYFDHLVVFLFRLHLANTLTVSEPSSLLSNTTHTSLSNLTPSSLSPMYALQCDLPHSAPPLDEDDCFIAIQRLPSHSEHAQFHRGSGRVPYQLPLSVSQGHCGITIDFIDHITEEKSSWDDLYFVAGAVIAECVRSPEGVGGSGFVGNNLLIRVRLQYIDEAAGRSNNNTILSSRTLSSSPLSASMLQCYPPGTGGVLETPDCWETLTLVSDSPIGGVFHRGGADDDCRLPVLYNHRTCDIIVDLVDDVQEERSNWFTVAWKIELLIVRCVQEGAQLGGEILVGEQKRIRVTVKPIIQPAGGTITARTY